MTRRLRRPILNRQASPGCRRGEIRARGQLTSRKGKRRGVDQRLRVRPSHCGARSGEPSLRGRRVGQRADTMRVRIAGAVKGRLGCSLQRDGGIVLLQPRRPSR